MGGNALKVPVVRLNATEFKEYESEVLSKLKKKFSKILPTLYYRNKPSFGDLDILVAKPKLNRDEFVQFLKDEFNTKDFYFNTDVVSFEYKNFQVDLIFVPAEDLEIAQFYYSYNDLNNLSGRVAHKLGVKFGFDGLNYVIRNEHGSISKKILITRDPRKIYDFIDLDYDRYLQGFDELEDIFEFILSSKYFSSSIFALENLNHQNRTRNRKRKTYQLFLNYLENNKIEKEFNYLKNKEEYIPYIEEFFDCKLSEKINRLREKFEYKKELSKRFNGDIIMKLIPIKGKELGSFIVKFKSRFVNFDEYLEKNNQEKINLDIVSFYETLNQIS